MVQRGECHLKRHLHRCCVSIRPDSVVPQKMRHPATGEARQQLSLVDFWKSRKRVDTDWSCLFSPPMPARPKAIQNSANTSLVSR